MTHIVILGGTGYAGSNIAKEAISRGFDVTSWSRSVPEEKIEGVEYKTGDLQDSTVLTEAADGADVVVASLSPRGALDGKLRGVYRELSRITDEKKVRLGVVGGAGSLLISEDGPALSSTPEFGEDYRSEAIQLGEVLDDLRQTPESLDWFLVSPAANFGAHNPGEKRGTYRIGGDVLFTDDNGESAISGSDFALAFVDEIAKPAHKRTRFSVAW